MKRLIAVLLLTMCAALALGNGSYMEAPQGLRIEADNDIDSLLVYLTQTNVPDSTVDSLWVGYIDAAGDTIWVAKLDSAATEARIGGLTPGTLYNFQVFADSGLVRTGSNVYPFRTEPLRIPQASWTSTSTTISVTVQPWPAIGDSMRILAVADSSLIYKWTDWTAKTAATYTITELTPGTTYQYYIVAYEGSASAWTAAQTVATSYPEHETPPPQTSPYATDLYGAESWLPTGDLEDTLRVVSQGGNDSTWVFDALWPVIGLRGTAIGDSVKVTFKLRTGDCDKTDGHRTVLQDSTFTITTSGEFKWMIPHDMDDEGYIVAEGDTLNGADTKITNLRLFRSRE